MEIIITKEKVSYGRLKEICEAWFGDMVKAVVDIEEEKIALGGDLHSEGETLLIQSGSRLYDLWGVNIYPWLDPGNRIEYTALINIRPKQSNASMEILDGAIRENVRVIVERLVISPNEKLV